MGECTRKYFLCIAVSLVAAANAVESLCITIDVFSGRPNPEFVLSDSATVELLRTRLARYSPTNSSIRPQSDCSCPARLGYRGLTVKSLTAELDYPMYRLCDGKIIYHRSMVDSRLWCYLDRHDEIARLVLSAGIRWNLTAHTVGGGSLRFADLVPDSIRQSLRTKGIVLWELFSPLEMDFSILHHQGRTTHLPSAVFTGKPDITIYPQPFPYPMKAPGGIAAVESNPFTTDRVFTQMPDSKSVDSLLSRLTLWFRDLDVDYLGLEYRPELPLEMRNVSYTLMTSEGYRAWLVPLAVLATAVPRNLFLWVCDAEYVSESITSTRRPFAVVHTGTPHTPALRGHFDLAGREIPHYSLPARPGIPENCVPGFYMLPKGKRILLE